MPNIRSAHKNQFHFCTLDENIILNNISFIIKMKPYLVIWRFRSDPELGQTLQVKGIPSTGLASLWSSAVSFGVPRPPACFTNWLQIRGSHTSPLEQFIELRKAVYWRLQCYYKGYKSWAATRKDPQGKVLASPKRELSWSPSQHTDVCHEPGTLTQPSVSRVFIGASFCRQSWVNPWPPKWSQPLALQWSNTMVGLGTWLDPSQNCPGAHHD